MWLTGKQHQVRLLPVSVLDNDAVEAVKVADVKGASLLTVGHTTTADGATCWLMCVAVKRVVTIYELDRSKLRHHKLRDITFPANVQTMDVWSRGRVCVGYPSHFVVCSAHSDSAPLCKPAL